MLTTLAVANYRSIRALVVPLGRLNLITGANGSGKSNLYRAWVSGNWTRPRGIGPRGSWARAAL
jgi:excinuclease UvrABC ATPase subunit